MATAPTRRRTIERAAGNLGAELVLREPMSPVTPRRLPGPRLPSGTGRQEGPWLLKPNEDGTARVIANLHEGQSAGMASEARTVGLISGSQSGKTSLGPLWLEREIRLQGPGDYLAVTATFPLLKRKMLPEFLKLFQGVLNLGHWSASDKMFVFHNGDTRVLFGSATNPESLESATAKAAWLDEAGQAQFRLEALEAIERRLALYEGRKFITSTPYNLGPLYTQIYKPALAGDREIQVIQFPSSINPSFPVEEMERQRDKLPLWKFRMFFEGRFDKPPGLIFGDYEDSYREQGGHLIKGSTMPIPAWWPRYLGLDFGGVHLARIFIAQDPLTNTFYVYDEQLSGGRTAAQHASDIISQLGGAPLYQSWGGAGSEGNWRLEFTAAGLVVEEPPMKDVEVGIDRVIALFKAKRLFVFDTCLGLRSELGAYSRKTGPDGDPLEAIQDKATYHRCLVAGTRVMTITGEIAIEDVQIGDLVLTRRGYRRVTDAACTERQAEIWRLEVSDGTVLQGTADHPVWVNGRGWVPLSRLTPSDTLMRCPRTRSSSSRAFATTATVGTSARVGRQIVKRSTSRSTKRRMARYRVAGTYTTRTITRSITISPILWLSVLGITCASILITLPRSDRKRRHGMPPKKVSPGTRSMARKPGRTETRSSAAASSAASRSDPRPIEIAIASARTSASPPGVEPAGWTMRRVSAPGVGLTFGSTAIRPSDVARAVARAEPGPPHVERLVHETPRQDVFNLTIEGEHEYFANGILTKNCDALRYVVSGLSGPQNPLPVLSMGRARGWQPRY